ncbi:protein adenylyltransferase SelO [Rhizobium sp. CC-YZS058]|uniref:protein adenylyltransferase SelO n=1 Tax=Rhizobium sp. CC-YZS058 TaxID=3042153 RepID=UPI002B05EE65|nr:YdiU family protein [Rhizobium sp. CC-YZS058]MEA3535577.1 YdiU family protein [Rhizobium sp. CC-YZS058]
MTDTAIAFDNSYARLPAPFFTRVDPTAVEAPVLIAFNRPLAEALGLDAASLERDGAEVFSGNRLLPGAEPLAMAYAGHQFGQFVPLLGDGRAILLGEVIDRAGQRRDIQLKGGGPTPYSRRGDGRAALGPVMREYLVSEAMHALGLPTTRALAAVVTGEPVYREQVLPGAVLTRVAASHLRVGTFQHFAARGDEEALRQLTDYAIARHDPALAGTPDRALGLLKAVAERQAALIARWLSIGFIHGVMNTDNFSISGETIDFGPCAFLDAYDPEKVFSSIDRGGRYAYQNQPAIGQWNLARLAEALLPLLNADESVAVDAANAVIADYGHRFQHHWSAAMRAKIGLTGPDDADDLTLVRDLLSLMQAQAADFTLSFRSLASAIEPGGESDMLTLFKDHEPVLAWLQRWRARLTRDGVPEAERARAMRAVNPAFIPRNHRIEQAIAAAQTEADFSLFEALQAVLSHPYDDQPQLARFAEPPGAGEEVPKTFCGT